MEIMNVNPCKNKKNQSTLCVQITVLIECLMASMINEINDLSTEFDVFGCVMYTLFYLIHIWFLSNFFNYEIQILQLK